MIRRFLVQLRHERKHANCQENRRRKRSKESKTSKSSEHEIRRDNCPRNECQCFVEIVDRAALEGESALYECGRVQAEGAGEQKVVNPVVLAKPFSPKEHRVHRADAVNHDCEQK